MRPRALTIFATVAMLAAGGAASAKDDIDHVTCESKDFGRNTCRADTRGNDVRLAEQTSKTRCVQGRNWGWYSGHVWVDRGCSGKFESRTDRPGDRRDDRRDDRRENRRENRRDDGLEGRGRGACVDAVAREPGIRRGDVRVLGSEAVPGDQSSGARQVTLKTPKGNYLCTVTPDGRVESVRR